MEKYPWIFPEKEQQKSRRTQWIATVEPCMIIKPDNESIQCARLSCMQERLKHDTKIEPV